MYVACEYRYIVQPPSSLDCDPLGAEISLECFVQVASDQESITWYWTQNVTEAGINGTPIATGNGFRLIEISSSTKLISFTVTESKLGYYWCAINAAMNISLRPSTITPICLPPTSLPNKCTNAHIINNLHHISSKCAVQNSTMVFARPPLPTSCSANDTSPVRI